MLSTPAVVILAISAITSWCLLSMTWSAPAAAASGAFAGPLTAAIHLRDTGTRAGDFLGAAGDGARVETDEFNVYRLIDGLMVELEGTADNARLSSQV